MKDVEFSRFDAADYIEDEDDVVEFLHAAMDEGGDDPAYIARALGVIARARNMSQLSRETGISRVGLNKALSGEGNPTLDTILKVSKALGLRLSFETVDTSEDAEAEHLEGAA
ncbi:addiction module antidote protein [Notoacmeibacter ruber]|uniref:Putative addiction module antidote protein n=1 Tax=Notoacmeibacter ruber TaxID=2670375 RepID=A0A3L7J2Y0_9HYPH|nr:addiction module antidote protein [Notoacmeibacter ruber]RLQ84983.1 putative addiction module antidote protein [Notoacmeibacter ruber]